MSMKRLKNHMELNGKIYYEKIVAKHEQVLEITKSKHSTLQAATSLGKGLSKK